MNSNSGTTISAGRIDVPIGPLVKDVRMTVRVTGTRVFQWRLTVCTWMIRLGAWIAGLGLSIDQKIEIDCAIKHK